MFSCCRCVNPKSPKYKKKGIEDDDSSGGEGNNEPCHGDNLSSEEEIKVEIIETDQKPVEGEPEVEAQPCDVIETSARPGSDSSLGEKVSLEQQNQDPSHVSSPKTSPNKSSTSSEHQQQSVVEETKPESSESTEPAHPASNSGSTAENIPTTVAEVEDASEITANESNSGKCEKNAVVVEEPKEAPTISPTENEPEPGEKSDHSANGNTSFQGLNYQGVREISS